MNWFVNFLNGGATPPSQIVSAAETVFATVRNGVQAVDAWQIGSALAVEATNLTQIQATPLALDTPTTAFFINRVNAVILASQQLALLTPSINLPASPTICATGVPAVPDPGLIEWAMAYNDETAPSPVTLPQSAVAVATAWQTVAMALAVMQGSNTTGIYDAAVRMASVSAMVANRILALTSGPFAASANTQSGWAQLVSLPTLLIDAEVLGSAPSTLINQQCGVIRYALITIEEQLSQLLLSLRKAQVGTASTATLRNNETLMDLAARSTGNFEDWTTIAAINGMVPPYPGVNNKAAVGRSLLLPSFGTVTPAPGTPIPSYAANVLGTDYDFGPLNATVAGFVSQGLMPAWTGDFNLITGYNNFSRAIGRRIQTTLGTLVYHQDYGSRIPPEVGAIQSADEAAKLNVFARSAITSDPRTGSIINCATTTRPGFLATILATISPIGLGATPVSINETLSPLP